MMKPEDYLQRAYRCILQNDFEQAIRWFETAILAYPGHAELYYRCSITQARSQHLSSALEYARKAVDLSGGTEEYLLHLHTLEAKQRTNQAKALLEQGDGKSPEHCVQAVALLSEAIRLDSLQLEAHVLLALAYIELNEFKRALSTVREALALDPQNVQLQQLLQQIKQRMKSIH
ncbi:MULTISPECIES: tetratricopeptide repeat protein [Paenibacillus]|uniref:tetratricopeptide repeat protein n=1 Tax=Paenibacillus TaxID=44249 RepID=UPI001F2AD5B0|nr:tetratricopeptide repeat protein [Paenibacillus sp. JJ-223]CAH1217254.1 hypothetical protein PAECIP111890_04559 [Paenibacillus sp. JJ-223]